MAVTKIWAIHDSVSRVVDYCSNPEKTRLTDLEQVLVYAANKAKTLDAKLARATKWIGAVFLILTLVLLILG